MGKPIVCVFATDEVMGFAKGGEIPWYVPEDRIFFKSVTTETTDPEKRNAVIMGRRTWEDLPKQHRPLSGRVNFVLSRDPSFLPSEPANIFPSLEEAVSWANGLEQIETIMVVGGEALLREAFLHPDCRVIAHTIIPGKYDCDQTLQVPPTFSLVEMQPIGAVLVYWFERKNDNT